MLTHHRKLYIVKYKHYICDIIKTKQQTVFKPMSFYKSSTGLGCLACRNVASVTNSNKPAQLTTFESYTQIIQYFALFLNSIFFELVYQVLLPHSHSSLCFSNNYFKIKISQIFKSVHLENKYNFGDKYSLLAYTFL